MRRLTRRQMTLTKWSLMSDELAEARLAGYEVVVGVCGGIAAYKVGHVVSRLVQRGAGVTTAMTEAATRFVGPLTFKSLTGRPVLVDLWTTPNAGDSQHIRVTERADLFVIAPATANMIGKIAAGIADDVVSTLVLSVDSPLVLAPSMNERMWSNQVVQGNVSRVREFGVHIVEPVAGWLACGTVGQGRMAEPDDIVSAAIRLLQANLPKSARKKKKGSG